MYAVSPASMPTGMTSSPSGRILYAGEGASIAVLDTEATDWWKNPLKIFTVSSLGIVPVEMVLDEASFPPLGRFEVSEDLTDQFRSDIYSVVLDEVEWVDEQQQARHELYIYLGASRVGIEVLHLDLDQLELEPPESPLVHLGIVQVPGEAEGLYIRLDPDTDERQLIVCNTWGGIRVLKYRF